MISDNERDSIQAEAYRKIKLLVDNRFIDWTETAQEISKLLEQTEDALKNHSMDINAVLHELDRTRWKRLQNTQFVYWPNRDHPRIEHSNGSQSYLIEHSHLSSQQLDNGLFDRLAQIEHDLFHTEDEAVVFWRGPNLWNIGKADRFKFGFSIQYCMCWTYDGETHLESRREPRWFHANPQALKKVSYRKD